MVLTAAETKERNRLAVAKYRAKTKDAQKEAGRNKRAANKARQPSPEAPLGYRADGKPRKLRALNLNWSDPEVFKSYHAERAALRAPERRIERKAERAADPEGVRAKERAARNNPRARAAAKKQNKKWNAKNPGKAAANSREWRRLHPDWHRANANGCRENRRQATPSWADKAAIRAVYAEAARLERETGARYEVDHIVPIKHPDVCGLHVSWNLRAVPWLENRAKANRFLWHMAFAPSNIPARFLSDYDLLEVCGGEEGLLELSKLLP